MGSSGSSDKSCTGCYGGSGTTGAGNRCIQVPCSGPTEPMVTDIAPDGAGTGGVAPAPAEAPTEAQDSTTKAVGDGYEEATRVYVDGSTYSGQMKGGFRDGQGVWLAPAVQYEGQWCADLQQGKGELSWADGRAYCGTFSQGKFHGQGRMVWNTPKGLLIYEGQYVEDAKHGTGKFEWPDGGVYEGEWSNGKMWGMGWYTDLNGERRQGEWVEDRIQRWLDEPAGEDTTALKN